MRERSGAAPVYNSERRIVSGGERREGGGCAAFIAVLLIIGAVVAAVISVAALVDPFSWLPPVGEIWEDCEESYDTPGDDCDLAARYPGFWPHVIANFAYAVVAAVSLAWLTVAVAELRAARFGRFSGPEAVERYAEARQALALVGGIVGALATLPIIVAII